MFDIPWARLLLTAALWSAWCVIHSLLNSEGPLGRTRIIRPSFSRHYRLIYNLIAVASLVLVSRITPRDHEMVLWAWNGLWDVPQFLLWGLAAYMFYQSFKLMGFLSFLGFKTGSVPLRPGDQAPGLVTSGIYGITRHPQFTAGLILLWTRDLTDAGLVINAVLSTYLVVGARIEEYRLLARYGAEYARYMREVPAFIPGVPFRHRVR